MLPETIGRLARDFSNIVGIKEATGSMKQGSEVVQSCPEGFSVLSGDDFTALPLWSVGGCGVISVTANIAPRRMASMWQAFKAGDLKKALEIHNALFPLHRAMFIESNPIPVKTALGIMGRMSEEMRLPLYKLSSEHREALVNELRKQQLI